MNPNAYKNKSLNAQSSSRGSAGVRAAHRFLGAVVLVLSLVAIANAQNMVGAPVDAGTRVSLKGHHPAWASAQNDQGAVPADLKLEQLIIILNRPPAIEKAYTQLLTDQQNPNSLRYHQWLTPAETGRRFGLSSHDIAAVTDWLKSQGLMVDAISNSRVRIVFSGTAAAVANAFGGEMHYFQVGEEKRISLTSAPQIPAALSAVIRAVSGLSTVKSYPQIHVSGESGTGGSQLMPATIAPEGSFTCGGSPCNVIMPGDFATIYNVNGVSGGINGAGETIAIVGRAKVCVADITNFATIAAVTIHGPNFIIPPGGVAPPAGSCSGSASLDQEEATLDVTRSGSVAQGATIDLVVSQSTGTQDGVSIAAQYIADNATGHIMSISFGGCEAEFGVSGVAFWDNIFQQAAGEGISSFVSSGDSGAAGCDTSFNPPPSTPSLPSPNAICSSSYTTCVGGTEFNDTSNPSQYWSPTNGTGYASALSYIPEGAWNEPGTAGSTEIAGTGGGVSSFIPTPSWQTGTGVPSARAGRYTPDIAFSASGHDAYGICLAAIGAGCTGSQFLGLSYGTSAAAPDMAGIAALLDQKTGSAQGVLNQELYTLAATPALDVFNDVTVSSSGVSGCSVTKPSMCNNSVAGASGLTGGTQGYLVNAGYDEATGLGSINVANLLASWGSGLKASQTALTTSAAQIPIGGSVTFTATVTPASGTGTPTGTVTFMDGTTTIGTGTLSAGVATFNTSTLASGVRSITAVYGGDSMFGTSTSPVLTETVGTLTQTTIQTSAAQVPVGTSVTFTATVAPTSGSGTPTGSVTFVVNGSSQIGVGTLTNGVATFVTNSPPFGINTITGVYNGDSTYAGSTSAGITQTVGTLTQTSLQTSAAQIAQGGSVTLTAIVAPTPGGTGTPTGFVMFNDGATTLGTVAVNAGTAVFTTSTLAAGTHSISAAYQTSSPFLASTSPVVTQSVVTISVAANPTSLSLVQGGNGTVSVSVTPTSGYSPKIAVVCTEVPSEATCTAGTPTTSNGVQTFQVSITTTAPHKTRQVPLGMFVPMGFLLPLGGLCIVARGKRRNLGWLGLTMILTAATLWLSACGGSSSPTDPGTPPRSYSLMMNASTSDKLAIKQTVSVTLKVSAAQ